MRTALEQQLAAALAQAAADGARWREEVNLKQLRIEMLAAGDRSKEADFMTQRVKELQVKSLQPLRLPLNTETLVAVHSNANQWQWTYAKPSELRRSSCGAKWH